MGVLLHLALKVITHVKCFTLSVVGLQCCLSTVSCTYKNILTLSLVIFISRAYIGYTLVYQIVVVCYFFDFLKNGILQFLHP